MISAWEPIPDLWCVWPWSDTGLWIRLWNKILRRFNLRILVTSDAAAGWPEPPGRLGPDRWAPLLSLVWPE